MKYGVAESDSESEEYESKTVPPASDDPFFQAVLDPKNGLESLKKLIKAFGYPFERTHNRPLFLAATNDRPDMVVYLLGTVYREAAEAIRVQNPELGAKPEYNGLFCIASLISDSGKVSPEEALRHLYLEFQEAQERIGNTLFAALLENREEKNAKKPLSAEETEWASSLFERVSAQVDSFQDPSTWIIPAEHLLEEDKLISDFDKLRHKNWLSAPSLIPHDKRQAFLVQLLKSGMLRLTYEMIQDDDALVHIYEPIYCPINTKWIINSLLHIFNRIVTVNYPGFSQDLTRLLDAINKIQPLADPYPYSDRNLPELADPFHLALKTRCLPAMEWLLEKGLVPKLTDTDKADVYQTLFDKAPYYSSFDFFRAEKTRECYTFLLKNPQLFPLFTKDRMGSADYLIKKLLDANRRYDEYKKCWMYTPDTSSMDIATSHFEWFLRTAVESPSAATEFKLSPYLPILEVGIGEMDYLICTVLIKAALNEVLNEAPILLPSVLTELVFDYAKDYHIEIRRKEEFKKFTAGFQRFWRQPVFQQPADASTCGHHVAVYTVLSAGVSFFGLSQAALIRQADAGIFQHVIDKLVQRVKETHPAQQGDDISIAQLWNIFDDLSNGRITAASLGLSPHFQPIFSTFPEIEKRQGYRVTSILSTFATEEKVGIGNGCGVYDLQFMAQLAKITTHRASLDREDDVLEHYFAVAQNDKHWLLFRVLIRGTNIVFFQMDSAAAIDQAIADTSRANLESALTAPKEYIKRNFVNLRALLPMTEEKGYAEIIADCKCDSDTLKRTLFEIESFMNLMASAFDLLDSDRTYPKHVTKMQEVVKGLSSYRNGDENSKCMAKIQSLIATYLQKQSDKNQRVKRSQTRARALTW